MTDEKKKGGWVKISRTVQEHWVWEEKPFSKGQAWIDLILLARHNDGTFMDRRGNLVEGKRGGIYRSERSLAERWEWSRKKTSNFLSRLVRDRMIEICKSGLSGENVIFIVNYDRFQGGRANSRDRTWDQFGKEEGTDREQNGASEGATVLPVNCKDFRTSGASERAAQEPLGSQSGASREPVGNTYKKDKNDKNEKKKEKDIVAPPGSTPSLPYFLPDSFEMRCVEALITSCLESYPKSKVPDTDEKKMKWAADIEKMKRIDGRDETEIWETLQFAIGSAFWHTNIRSAKKFREKYETLYLQNRQAREKSSTPWKGIERVMTKDGRVLE